MTNFFKFIDDTLGMC